MKARDIMTKNPSCCTPNDSAQDAARAMRDNDCGCVPIIDPESRIVIGMVTDRDLAMRGIAEGKGPETKLNELMTSVASCCGPNDDVRDVERTMGDLQVRRIPIVDAEGCCVGIISQADIALAAKNAKVTEHEVAIVVERISEPGPPGGRRTKEAPELRL